MKYEQYFKEDIEFINQQLKAALPPESHHPALLHEAMHYAVFSGGKRFRSILTLAACEAAGGQRDDAALAAVAVEFIHAYSLVHDDLPALDNDDIRRGKPTCHKRFGEATAILAGDGLLTRAFQVLSRVQPQEKALQLILEISTAAGTYGMIGGQAVDLEAEQSQPDVSLLDFISIHKTGQLIKASVVCGAIAANAPEEDRHRLLRYGEFVGMAFQSVDDLIDGDGYLRLLKAKDVEAKIRDLIANAKREIRPFGNEGEKLKTITDFLIQRIPRGSHVKVD